MTQEEAEVWPAQGAALDQDLGWQTGEEYGMEDLPLEVWLTVAGLGALDRKWGVDQTGKS